MDEKISISNYTLSASVSAPLYSATNLIDLLSSCNAWQVACGKVCILNISDLISLK